MGELIYHQMYPLNKVMTSAWQNLREANIHSLSEIKLLPQTKR